MSLKQRLSGKALELGFTDIGFTTTEPLDLYIQEIDSRPQMYDWLMTEQFNVKRGAFPREKHPWARSLLVLIRNYHRRSFPPSLKGKIGRCYQVDERKEKGEEHRRIKDYLDFLIQEGIRVYFDGETPARMSAARAGVVTYGKNCFVYARKSMLGASWLESIPLLLDAEIEPDEPSVELGCPSWCKNACIAACPTGALYSPKKMNPRRCIAYQSYYSSGITPLELREPMGTWVYGCDRCQEVCPAYNTGKLLSPAALETLAIIAYKQPITRLEIDQLRGLNSDGAVKTLLDKRLIKIIGKKESPGRPFLYGSTKEFLQYFGLKNLSDLPPINDFLREDAA